MTNQSTIDKLIEMRLTTMADAFRNQLDDTKFKDVPFEDRFGMLVDIEYSNRKNNRQKRLIRNLSGGYQQRLGIAQAIVHNPDFVVFDEPTNGLDPNQIAEVRNLIKKIAEDRTVILSTHILPEVQAVCDHIFMIENGQLIFSGTVRDFDNYIIPNMIFVSLRVNPGEAELKELEGVLDVSYLGGIHYRLKYNDAVDVIDRVVEASVRKGWHLTEIRQEKSSLDSIFAELSKKSK